jgi:hypothetical protein
MEEIIYFEKGAFASTVRTVENDLVELPSDVSFELEPS